MELTKKYGVLEDTIQYFIPSTIQHADEINQSRLSSLDLCNDSFWTADFPLYVMEKGQSILYLARAQNNILFQESNLSRFQNQEESYLSPSEVNKIKNSPSTVKIALDQLRLETSDGEWPFLEIEGSR